jgi:hypothetical protein
LRKDWKCPQGNVVGQKKKEIEKSKAKRKKREEGGKQML